MPASAPLDLVVKNVRVVRPHRPAVDLLDLGVKDGRFARVAPAIPPGDAREVYDGRGLLGFPGALEAALVMRDAFPHVDFRREVTVGHLLLDYDTKAGAQAKVNPPIRSRDDVEYLWQALLERKVDWVVSDHACCATEVKLAAERPDDVWLAKAGFGGTEYLLSGVFSEGSKRGMSYAHMAEVTSGNPARRFGLLRKGDIAIGYDADLALLDPTRSFTVRGAESPSAQGYTPFEGLTLTGQVRATFLRGQLVSEQGKIVGPARGQYVKRPTPGPA